MRGHQICFDLSQSLLCPRPSIQGPSSSWQHFSFPPVVIPTSVGSPSPRASQAWRDAWRALCQSTAPWPLLGWDREGPLHPGFSEVTLFGNPQVQICLIYLEEKQRKPTLPTAPNKNTPSYIPCGKCQQVPPTAIPTDQRQPSSGPQKQDRWATGVPRDPTTRHRSSPHLDQEPKVSAGKAGGSLLPSHNHAIHPNPGDLLSPYLPTIVLLSDYENNVSPL